MDGGGTHLAVMTIFGLPFLGLLPVALPVAVPLALAVYLLG